MLDEFITERKIEYRHKETDKDSYVLEFEGDSARLNIDQKSYREQLITYDSDFLTRTRDEEIKRNVKYLNKRKVWWEISTESE